MNNLKKYFDLKLLFICVCSALIYSFAIVNFSIPAATYPAGFSGLSRIISDVLSDFFNLNISYSVLYFALNIVVTIFVFRRIGKKFAIYSTLQFVFVSIFSGYLKPVLHINEVILMCIFGGIVNGIGVGSALHYNFSTGGSDFISIYFANKYNKDIWNYIFATNVVILMVAGLIYGWERSLYSIIYQYASTQVIKTLHKRYTHKTLSIITKYPDEVCKAVLANVRHGITEIKAEGYYSHSDTTMLYTVVNTFQYKEVIKTVMKADPHAFINVQNTYALYGNYYQQPLD